MVGTMFANFAGYCADMLEAQKATGMLPADKGPEADGDGPALPKKAAATKKPPQKGAGAFGDGAGGGGGGGGGGGNDVQELVRRLVGGGAGGGSGSVAAAAGENTLVRCTLYGNMKALENFDCFE